jgi:hypothetical protein
MLFKYPPKPHTCPNYIRWWIVCSSRCCNAARLEVKSTRTHSTSTQSIWTARWGPLLHSGIQLWNYSFLVLKYCHEYLDASSKSDLLSFHTIINHMDTMLTPCATYDFTWIGQQNLRLWEKQEHINPEKVKACMSGLFYYDLEVFLMTRYLGTPP